MSEATVPFEVGDRVEVGPQKLWGAIHETNEREWSVWVKLDRPLAAATTSLGSSLSSDHVGEWSVSDVRLLSVVELLAQLDGVERPA